MPESEGGQEYYDARHLVEYESYLMDQVRLRKKLTNPEKEKWLLEIAQLPGEKTAFDKWADNHNIPRFIIK